jgi:uncharacterized membrane protein YccF (DUF307 family)
MSAPNPPQYGGNLVFIPARQGPGCLGQALWFVFIGWWLGAISIVVAWFFNVTILGLPLGLAILNNIPRILALQEPRQTYTLASVGGLTAYAPTAPPQRRFLIRALFFVVVGWWWSALWLVLGYLLCATILLMPLGLAMFRLAPTMTTLRRY